MKQQKYKVTLKNKTEIVTNCETFGQQGALILFFNRGEDQTPDEIVLAIHADEVFKVTLLLN